MNVHFRIEFGKLSASTEYPCFNTVSPPSYESADYLVKWYHSALNIEKVAAVFSLFW